MASQQCCKPAQQCEHKIKGAFQGHHHGHCPIWEGHAGHCKLPAGLKKKKKEHRKKKEGGCQRKVKDGSADHSSDSSDSGDDDCRKGKN